MLQSVVMICVTQGQGVRCMLAAAESCGSFLSDKLIIFHDHVAMCKNIFMTSLSSFSQKFEIISLRHGSSAEML